MSTTIILGIDPGSRITGYGVISSHGNTLRFLGCGTIRTQAEHFPERLQTIFTGINEVVQQYAPHEAGIEDIFQQHNVASALKLGQARGAAIAAITTIPIATYTARQVKQAVVGYGAAQKQQVQHMVARLLNLASLPSPDAADALAIAVCHANMRQGVTALAPTQRLRRGRMR